MKDLFKSHFVVKNSTSAQRLAINAFCEEKAITSYLTAEFNIWVHVLYESVHHKFITCGESYIQDKNIEIITFNELITFLNDYQVCPFKDDDYIVAQGTTSPERVRKIIKPRVDDKNLYWYEGIIGNEHHWPVIDCRLATKKEIDEFENKNKLPVINGYYGLLKDGMITYNGVCAVFDAEFFINLAKVYAGQNRTIKSITLSSGVQITIDDINQIVKAINESKYIPLT